MRGGRDATTRWVPMFAALLLALAGCSSGTPEDASTGPTPPSGATGPTAPTGASGGPALAIPDACVLVTDAEASAVLEGQVESVADPFAAGLVQANPADFASFCFYRPVPDDGRFVSIGVFDPASFSDATFRAQVDGGLALGGPGDEGYEVNGGVIFRSGDIVVGIIAITTADSAPDRSAALELALTAETRLPRPAADPDNLACRLLAEVLTGPVLGEDLAYDDDRILDEQRSGCRYAATDGPTSVTLEITQGPDAAADYATVRESAAEGSDFREVDGLGDEAFTINDVFVLSGDTLMKVSVLTPEGPSAEEALRIAGAVVAEL